MSDTIRLVRPAAEHKAQALAFREEFFAHGEPVIACGGIFERSFTHDGNPADLYIILLIPAKP